MQKIDGKALAQKVKDEVKEKLKSDKFKSIPDPHLVVIQVADDPASEVYIRNKKKACEEVGIKFSHYHYKEEVTTKKLVEVVKRLSLTPTVTGILVQLPLPNHIDKEAVIEAIDPRKDVDGFTTTQAGMLQLGMRYKRRLLPCTAKGIVRLLKSVTNVEGKNINVIGRSNIVGKPVAQLLQEENATVKLCHSATYNMYNENADIIISAIGKPKYFNGDNLYSKYEKCIDNIDTCILIDAGINRDENGKLCGDMDINDNKLNELLGEDTLYTPVPGGVGPMTIAELIDNIYIAYENQFNIIWNYYQNREIAESGLNGFDKGE